jgi:hypothetical protein
MVNAALRAESSVMAGKFASNVPVLTADHAAWRDLQRNDGDRTGRGDHQG